MDSVTHIVLGAAIGDALLGKKIGRKAMLVGAIAKSVPDFDLFYTGLKDPRLYMACHRGHTHSLFWESLYAFPLALILFWIFGKKVKYTEWLLLFFVCLFGHSLLDTCTNFGTSLFLPFTNNTYAWNNLAIVDLLFTAPMIIMLIGGLIAKNNSRPRFIFIKSLLIYCCAYLGFTLVNKTVAEKVIAQSLETQHIAHQQFFTNPTILNNILWYGMAVNDSTLSVGEFTLLKKDKPIQWLSFTRNNQLLDEHPDTADVKLLKWFSKGYTICEKDGDTLNVYCTKFGRTNMTETNLEKTFIFHYKLYYDKGAWQMGMEEPNDQNADMKKGFFDIIKRIKGDLS